MRWDFREYPGPPITCGVPRGNVCQLNEIALSKPLTDFFNFFRIFERGMAHDVVSPHQRFFFHFQEFDTGRFGRSLSQGDKDSRSTFLWWYFLPVNSSSISLGGIFSLKFGLLGVWDLRRVSR
jgi:hypothetical protein